ncbi:hypothetical protein B7463_g156, partial [Scytalidium lignicola]
MDRFRRARRPVDESGRHDLRETIESLITVDGVWTDKAHAHVTARQATTVCSPHAMAIEHYSHAVGLSASTDQGRNLPRRGVNPEVDK